MKFRLCNAQAMCTPHACQNLQAGVKRWAAQLYCLASRTECDVVHQLPGIWSGSIPCSAEQNHKLFERTHKLEDAVPSHILEAQGSANSHMSFMHAAPRANVGSVVQAPPVHTQRGLKATPSQTWKPKSG